jgi:phosphoglycerate dehydrogenase-like enzyme
MGKDRIVKVMNIALLLSEVSAPEMQQLAREFPELLFLCYPRHPIQPVPPEHWMRTEVVYGERLTEEELAQAPQLRYIHSPSSNLNRLCLKEIERRGNILISFTREAHAFTSGEFVMSAILAYAKNLFQWKEADRFPHLVWDCKWRNKMWSLKDKVLLQIGLSEIGLEIARRAAEAGMKVWGMDHSLSYKPHCKKQLLLSELNQALPVADVISISLPRDQAASFKLGFEELALIKQDAILSILGSPRLIDEEALFQHASKFRGILLDAYYQNPLSPRSKLWLIPNLMITPEVAPRPKSSSRESARIFRYNLRQYLHDNYTDMKNLVDPTVAFAGEIENS